MLPGTLFHNPNDPAASRLVWASTPSANHLACDGEHPPRAALRTGCAGQPRLLQHVEMGEGR